LNEYIVSKSSSNEKKYIFIDEIQKIKKWEIVINSLRNKNKFDIYITGSNASLLCSELSTLLSGRYVKFLIRPFCFNEIVEFYKDENLTNSKIFDNYLNFGGMPQLLTEKKSMFIIRCL
jgi:predicted AAA+ superfamily ATPase